MVVTPEIRYIAVRGTYASEPFSVLVWSHYLRCRDGVAVAFGEFAARRMVRPVLRSSCRWRSLCPRRSRRAGCRAATCMGARGFRRRGRIAGSLTVPQAPKATQLGSLTPPLSQLGRARLSLPAHTTHPHTPLHSRCHHQTRWPRIRGVRRTFSRRCSAQRCRGAPGGAGWRAQR